MIFPSAEFLKAHKKTGTSPALLLMVEGAGITLGFALRWPYAIAAG
jgi:hypothetical protein